jgi:hypothetical protein
MKTHKSLLCAVASISALWAGVQASDARASSCAYDVGQSSEIGVPPSTERVPHALWSYAANYSSLEWRVSVADGHICADLVPDTERLRTGARPAFEPEADGFRGASQFARVNDGWLVGFNHGEFGAALYWFSKDGRRHYRMSAGRSDPQVVAFFPLGNDLGAIEGLAHLGLSKGSIIRIARTAAQDRWQVQTVVRLPAAPYAVAVPRSGPVLVVLWDCLVAFDGLRQVEPLLATAPWSGLYPNSAVLSPDEQKLYIGMRQYVGEFDLKTRQLRMLLPLGANLNRLSPQEEQQIRASESR